MKWIGLATAVAAVLVLAKHVDAEGDKLSAELRFGVFSPAYRWSKRSGSETTFDTANRSIYFVPSLEARVFPRSRHGVTLGVDYRFDFDAENFCVLGSCRTQVEVDFVVGRAGYAYRFVHPSRKRPDRRAWAVTPHASISAGAAISRVLDGATVEGISRRSPVVGGRLGIDVDFHIRRFFFGWSLGYELLRHTRGSIRYSHFLSWNAIPLFRIGVVLGGRVQAGDDLAYRR